MIKKLLIILIIAIFLAGSYIYGRHWAGNLYENIDASGVPVPPATVAGQTVYPVIGRTEIPVFGEWQVLNPELASYAYGLLFLGTEVRPEKSLTFMLDDDMSWRIVTDEFSFGGLLPDSLSTDLGLIGEAPYILDAAMTESVLPDGYEWGFGLSGLGPDGKYSRVQLTPEDDLNELYGPFEKAEMQGMISKAGDYRLDIIGTVPRTEEDILLTESFINKRLDLRWGLFYPGWEDNSTSPKHGFAYSVIFSVKNPDPVFTVGRTELQQGDILAIKLENVPEGIRPELETELGPAIFTNGVPASRTDKETSPLAEGFESWFAAVPVSNIRAPGIYTVTVTAGELVYEASVTVSEYEFDFQDLIIDMSVPSNAAATSPKAGAEFREKVTPLFPVLSEEIYWSGPFIMPVDLGKDGFISTQFGEIRITNGNMNTKRSHLGMDIAVKTGTLVHAAGAGRVLLAEFLLMTGNTVIIDHGGGLKSIYYHMNSVNTEAGRVVEQGELIGTVGSTGYSTGPHLHFEMRIGEQPISPSMLLDENAGLYSVW